MKDSKVNQLISVKERRGIVRPERRSEKDEVLKNKGTANSSPFSVVASLMHETQVRDRLTCGIRRRPGIHHLRNRRRGQPNRRRPRHHPILQIGIRPNVSLPRYAPKPSYQPKND